VTASVAAQAKSTTKAATPVKAAKPSCKRGYVPVGENDECMKACASNAECAKGQECLPASFEMDDGQLAHVRACF
jgi:hypothetical protein